MMKTRATSCFGRSRACSLLALFGGALALALAPAVGYTQVWPTKPIRLLHGFGPGGAVDISTRVMMAPMADLLGQQMVIDARPGAGGTMAARIVSKADADGYTLYLMISGHTTAASLFRKLPYDAVGDFTAIGLLASTPFVVVVADKHPARTIEDLIKLAKAQPGKLDYATGGVGTGTHLAAALMQSRLGVHMMHVPYRGANTVLALTSGEVQLIVGTPAGILSFLGSGRIRPLAVTTAKRLSIWPGVPTLAETVLPGFEAAGWFMLAAPKNLPREIVQRVHQAAVKALERTDVIEKLLTTGTVVTLKDPAASRQFLIDEVARWGKVIRDEHIPPQD